MKLKIFTLFALVALAVGAKSVDDFVGVYTKPVNGINWTRPNALPSGLVLTPYVGMPVNSNSMSSIGFTYDRYCGLHDLTSPGFSDADNKRTKSFTFAPTATREEIAEGNDLGVENFNDIAGAVAAFFEDASDVVVGTGASCTPTPLYCKSAADYEGDLFSTGVYDTPPSGTIAGNPCRGGANIDFLGVTGSGGKLAQVGSSFASGVYGTFETESGADETLQYAGSWEDGSMYFEDGELIEYGADSPGIELMVKPWLMLNDLARAMNAWAAYCGGTIAQNQQKVTSKSASYKVTITRELDVDVDISTTTPEPVVSTNSAATRKCKLKRVNQMDEEQTAFDAYGTTHEIYKEYFLEPWSLYSSVHYGTAPHGYTVKCYKCRSFYLLDDAVDNWTGVPQTFNFCTITEEQTKPEQAILTTDKLLTDAQKAYYQNGKLCWGGKVTKNVSEDEESEPTTTEQYHIYNENLQKENGYQLSSALSKYSAKYMIDQNDESEIGTKVSEVWDVECNPTLQILRPGPKDPSGRTRYRYEYIPDTPGETPDVPGHPTPPGAFDGTNQWRYIGQPCECGIDGCTCVGCSCMECIQAFCDCCPGYPQYDDEEQWECDPGDDDDPEWDPDDPYPDPTDPDNPYDPTITPRIMEIDGQLIARATVSPTEDFYYEYERIATSPKGFAMATIGGTSDPLPPSPEEQNYDYYVDPSAPSGGDGSKDNPFNNLEDAITATAPVSLMSAPLMASASAGATQETNGTQLIAYKQGRHKLTKVTNGEVVRMPMFASAAPATSWTNGIPTIALKSGVYTVPSGMNRHNSWNPQGLDHDVRIIGIESGVIIRNEGRYISGHPFDFNNGEPKTSFENLTFEFSGAKRYYYFSMMRLVNCKLRGDAHLHNYMFEASYIHDCTFTKQLRVHSYSPYTGDWAGSCGLFFGSYVSNCVVDATTYTNDMTVLQTVSTVEDSYVNDGAWRMLSAHYTVSEQTEQGMFYDSTVCADILGWTNMVQHGTYNDYQNMFWPMPWATNCIFFVDGMTNIPPHCVDNIMTNRASRDVILNKVNRKPKTQWRSWRSKGYHRQP